MAFALCVAGRLCAPQKLMATQRELILQHIVRKADRVGHDATDGVSVKGLQDIKKLAGEDNPRATTLRLRHAGP
jgi:hypothetical protein